MGTLLVAGSINMDVVNKVKTHPKPGETVYGLQTKYYPGGKGANQAVAAARAGARVAMIGAVGTDAFGEDLRNGLAANGVNTEHVLTREGESGLAFITVDREGENTIVLQSGANGKIYENDINDRTEFIRSAKILLLQNEVPWETNAQLILTARTCSVPIYYNPAPYFRIPEAALALIDTIFVNESEAEATWGRPVDSLEGARIAAALFIDAGTRAVVITMGEKGSYYADRHKRTYITPALNVNPVDTTAAGDTFIGYFTAGLLRGMTIEESLRFATAAAAISVTRPGAQTSIPEYAECIALMND